MLLFPHTTFTVQTRHTSSGAHWPTGTITLLASPSHTPTAPSVHVCLHGSLLRETWSKCHRGPSLSHPHSSFAAPCRRRLLGSCDDHRVVFVRCPHKTKRRLPWPLRHICQAVYLSICTSLRLLWSPLLFIHSRPPSASLHLLTGRVVTLHCEPVSILENAASHWIKVNEGPGFSTAG